MARAQVKARKLEAARTGRPKDLADGILTLDLGETIETEDPPGTWGLRRWEGERDTVWFEPFGRREAFERYASEPGETYSLRQVQRAVREILAELAVKGAGDWASAP